MEIIISEHAKSHMLCHNDEFFKGWYETFEQIKDQGFLENLSKPSEVISIALDEKVGYCNLVDTTNEDEIIYAKRLERELYTRFVKGRTPVETNNVLIVLRKSEVREDAYDFITMYPGFPSEKEPEDLSIASKEELERSLKFWSSRALIYNEAVIESGTEKAYCPYQNLYYVFE